MTDHTDLLRIFAGSEKHHQLIVFDKTPEGEIQKDEKGKVKTRVVTNQGVTSAPQPPTPELAKAHLDGTGDGLGVFPLREDDSVAWGSFDIDDYALTPEVIDKRIQERELPLIAVRSKSGGTHVFAFAQGWVDPELMREALDGYRTQLQVPSSVIDRVPDQTEAHGGTRCGTGISMPYYGARSTEGTHRCAVWNGEDLSLDAFVAKVDELAVTENTLQQAARGQAFDDGGWVTDGPPCLQQIVAEGGISENGQLNDGRRKVLTQYAVYLRKFFTEHDDDEMWQNLQAYNEAFMSPKLEDKHLKKIFKEAMKNKPGGAGMAMDYVHCGKSPCFERCAWKTCKSRHYGKFKPEGGSDSRPSPEIESLTQYVDHHGNTHCWVAVVDGTDIELTESQLISPAALRPLFIERLHRVPPQMKPEQWDDYLQKLLDKANRLPAPLNKTLAGTIAQAFDGFLDQRAQGAREEDMLKGLPFKPGDGFVYFQIGALLEYVKQHSQVPYDQLKDNKALWREIESRGGDECKREINGKEPRIIYVPDTSADAPSEAAAAHANVDAAGTPDFGDADAGHETEGAPMDAAEAFEDEGFDWHGA